MSTISNGYILNEVSEQFPDSVIDSLESYGMLSIEVKANDIVAILSFLKSHPQIQMNFLTDVCGIHYPDQSGKELGVVYHLHSFTNNVRLRLKCFIPAEKPEIPTITSVFEAANWQERETFDFYGIEFVGHPNLTRILNVDEMDYFPLRKEYPLEDQTRTDKDDSYFGR
jgi:NADH-quinone oxidoreductase subunit C